ncbi:hypothetical protein CNMCM8694_003509 [Aspergillus lentulus]|nr:hypothetical protein CNMCM8060_009679 [Aspergillus lentulus]KAF4179683.1 hypothetical protein CNMCM7927_001790 [Aspergillus lentulus]KAF4190619.1 hypothetical protein CNMCM8694_003509 [Aspergillus lentulus]
MRQALLRYQFLLTSRPLSSPQMSAQLRKRNAAMAIESGREEYVQPHSPGGLRSVDEDGKLFLFVSWYFCLFLLSRHGDAWTISLSLLPITSEVKGRIRHHLRLSRVLRNNFPSS